MNYILNKKLKNLQHQKSLLETLRYLLTGGATTLVNYIVYLMLLGTHTDYLTANTIAWIFAVLFAYITNRIFVFHSENQIGKELVSFVSLRFLTLLLENLLLAFFIQQCNFHPMISKIAVSLVTIIGNYVICKCQIFQKSGKYPTQPANIQKGENSHE